MIISYLVYMTISESQKKATFVLYDNVYPHLTSLNSRKLLNLIMDKLNLCLDCT